MPKNKPPEVIISLEPSPNFEQEFLEFIETVLSWPEKEKLIKPKKYGQKANRRI